MAMYAISVIPLIDAIRNCDVRQAWFTDDATAAGSLSGLREWLSGLVRLGPAYDNHVKPSKSWLIVKPDYFNLAKEVFADCGVGITAEGKHHLGAAIGSRAFVEQYVIDKVDYWVSCVRKLSAIAMTHPQRAVRNLKTRQFMSQRTQLCINQVPSRSMQKPLRLSRDADRQTDRRMRLYSFI